MKHFLYAMHEGDKAPAGVGDTGSWFRYYKWNTEGEVFVPRRAPFLPIATGDMLWFSMGWRLLGCAPVLRIEEEYSQGVQEIWYEAEKIRRIPDHVVLLVTSTADSTIHPEEAEKWLTILASP